MPTLAIVDSRNVHGQTAAVLGVGRCPSVQGVVDGLALYGFDVTAVKVGLALARTRDRSALAMEHAANQAYMAEILSDLRGSALLGELHLKDLGPPRRVEEKIVDVQLALAVALAARDISDGRSTYDSIVVCSQDIDLRPALEYATGLNVPIWVAAHEVVDRRAEPHLLLTTEALRRFRPPPGNFGHDRRALVAAAALSPDMRDWYAIEPVGQNGFWLIEDAVGTPGLCRGHLLGSSPQPGCKMSLGVAGIHTGRTGRDFPVVRVDRHPAPAPLAVEGEVVRRVRLDKLSLDVAGMKTELPYPPGGVLAKWRVAVQVNAAAGTLPTHVVLGPVRPPTVTNSMKTMVVTAEPVIATSTGERLSEFRSKMSSSGGTLVLDHARGKAPAKGVKIAVALADFGTYHHHPVAHAISAPLD